MRRTVLIYSLFCRSIRHHSHLARSFDGGGNLSLVMAAQSGFLFTFDFVKTRNKTHQQLRVFIIDIVYIFLTKITKHLF